MLSWIKSLWHTPRPLARLFWLPLLGFVVYEVVWVLSSMQLFGTVYDENIAATPNTDDSWGLAWGWFVGGLAVLVLTGCFWLALVWKNAFNVKHAFWGYVVRTLVAIKLIWLALLFYGFALAGDFHLLGTAAHILIGTESCKAYHSERIPDSEDLPLQAACECQQQHIAARTLASDETLDEKTRAFSQEMFSMLWMDGCDTSLLLDDTNTNDSDE